MTMKKRTKVMIMMTVLLTGPQSAVSAAKCLCSCVAPSEH
jgi:hypothetical protein